MNPRIKIVLIAIPLVWILTLGIYIERGIDSLPCSNDVGNDLSDVVDGALYLNAYINTPERSQFAIPGIFGYSAPKAPFSLSVVGFVPEQSGFDTITVDSVTFVSGDDRSSHKIGSNGELIEFRTSHGLVRSGSVQCGRIIHGGAFATMVVTGSMSGATETIRFRRTLAMPITRSFYLYPGWAFIFLPMDA